MLRVDSVHACERRLSRTSPARRLRCRTASPAASSRPTTPALCGASSPRRGGRRAWRLRAPGQCGPSAPRMGRAATAVCAVRLMGMARREARACVRCHTLYCGGDAAATPHAVSCAPGARRQPSRLVQGGLLREGGLSDQATQSMPKGQQRYPPSRQHELALGLAAVASLACVALLFASRGLALGANPWVPDCLGGRLSARHPSALIPEARLLTSAGC
jgi:hypothetical protein